MPTAAAPAIATRSDAARGIGLMLAGILLFALNDVLGKWLVATYGVGQIVLIRSAAALLVLAPLLPGRTRLLVHPRRPFVQAARVALSSVEVVLFYAAVALLPLADAMTYWLAAPIYVAALSPWLLGETLGWRRWSAILAGFLGVVIALKPSASTLTPAALVAVAGSAAFALMTVTGRALRGTPDLSLVFWQNAGALAVGAVLAALDWTTPSPRDAALLAVLGVVALGAHLLVNRSLKLATAATVTPYQYTLLVWAIVFGYGVFGEVPAPATLAGAAVIVGSGLVILYRERVRRVASDGPVTPAGV